MGLIKTPLTRVTDISATDSHTFQNISATDISATEVPRVGKRFKNIPPRPRTSRMLRGISVQGPLPRTVPCPKLLHNPRHIPL